MTDVQGKQYLVNKDRGERRRVKDLEYIIYFVINFESSTVANEVIKRNTDLLAPGHPIRGASAGQCSRACA
jgi:hypothetical protein